MATPRVITPVYALTRILFNESLRWREFPGELTVGIDADGYSLPHRKARPHIACIKGVLADALPFETGATRASLAVQARLEAKNARRAGLVITISRYCAQRIADLYNVPHAVVVPELIDIDSWVRLLRANPRAPGQGPFTVLSVCRFYPRKRLDILLHAAAILRQRIPKLEIRIVGDGPERARLRQLSSDLNLAPVLRWLGDLSISELAAEYNRADVFCLPSLQEGFGIVFLEAMLAGKPIVASRAAAVPEVVRHGILGEPGKPDAIAEALFSLYRDPDLAHSLGAAGRVDVQQYDINRVARQFLTQVATLIPVANAPVNISECDQKCEPV